MNDRRASHYPFAAIVGQDELRLGLKLNVIDPSIGGVMIMGHRGCAKSTAVRALADVLPPIRVVDGCTFNCSPEVPEAACDECAANPAPAVAERPVPVVDLPLGATEDRVTGSLDLEAALVRGERKFEPGLLARANRGFLYIDEANLLEDHLVDLLLDVAAAGENVVERESVSVRHPARFVLVGSGNPEEGELRPQLLDRFGLFVEVVTPADPEARAEVVRRRLAFDADPAGFAATWAKETGELRERIARAAAAVGGVELPEEVLVAIAELNARLGVDGHRGELTLARAGRAHAAWHDRDRVTHEDIHAVARLALAHRLRRDPLDARDASHRLDEALAALAPTR